MQINLAQEIFNCAHRRLDSARVVAVDPKYRIHVRLDVAGVYPVVPAKHLHHLGRVSGDLHTVSATPVTDLDEGVPVVHVGHVQADRVPWRPVRPPAVQRRRRDLAEEHARRCERPRYEGRCSPGLAAKKMHSRGALTREIRPQKVHLVLLRI